MTWRDHLRAALIALALVAHGIYALPLPRRVTETGLKEEWRQRDIAMWQRWLDGAGFAVTHEQIEAGLMWVTDLSATTHQTLKAPFQPLFRLTSSNQAWALFAGASTKPERIVVEVRDEGSKEWRPILRRLDPCCTWKDPVFRYRRIRGVWDGQKKRTRKPYQNLTLWTAARVFEEMPEVVEVKVFLEEGRSVYPWQPPDNRLTIRHRRRHRRPEEAP